ncbi:MAG: type II toxin-antitoxin system RelE/ParE family toxin [Acidobacteria bacterium]|nr:type II toxin-antitoxin system RelE/ParE family toxin [Acidobacteriota bacterium]
MKHVGFSDLAVSDLEEIWNYIARDNAEAATRFIRSFDPILVRLANDPYLGRSRDDIIKDLRHFPHGRYVIYYFPAASGVRIYRVLHSARNHKKIFSKENE